MSRAQIGEVAEAVKALGRDLEALAKAGRGIPAVEKNAVRLKGTLKALEDQFLDLASGEEGR